MLMHLWLIHDVWSSEQAEPGSIAQISAHTSVCVWECESDEVPLVWSHPQGQRERERERERERWLVTKEKEDAQDATGMLLVCLCLCLCVFPTLLLCSNTFSLFFSATGLFPSLFLTPSLALTPDRCSFDTTKAFVLMPLQKCVCVYDMCVCFFKPLTHMFFTIAVMQS